jgi:hypothetical protein
MAEPKAELRWVNRGLVVARFGDKSVQVGGEAMLARDPDYVIYASTITTWDDGSPIGGDELADVLDRVVEAASRRGWKFEVEWW